VSYLCSDSSWMKACKASTARENERKSRKICQQRRNKSVIYWLPYWIALKDCCKRDHSILTALVNAARTSSRLYLNAKQTNPSPKNKFYILPQKANTYFCIPHQYDFMDKELSLLYHIYMIIWTKHSFCHTKSIRFYEQSTHFAVPHLYNYINKALILSYHIYMILWTKTRLT
jgi:hypothetical protein